jgi:hypothetical protein
LAPIVSISENSPQRPEANSDKLLQLVFALRSLVAFHVGLGVSTTVRLVRAKGWAALCSFVGVVYLRESVSRCRPLLSVFYLCAHPLCPPEKYPRISRPVFFFDLPHEYFEGRLLIGLLFLFVLNCDIRREGSPRTAKWVF